MEEVNVYSRTLISLLLESKQSRRPICSFLLFQLLIYHAAFHPSGVGKSSTHWLRLRRGCVRLCRVTHTLDFLLWHLLRLDQHKNTCDPIWQATPRSSEIDFH